MKKRIFITVKTYPSLSRKFDELVCTAGITEEGDWIRIYPIVFRGLDYEKQYKKYQWIELALKPNGKDSRVESFNPVNIEDIVLGEIIGTDGGTWERRKEIVLKNVHMEMGKLICKTERRKTSLAVFKPTEILRFSFKKEDEDCDQKKRQAFEDQFKLFPKERKIFEPLVKLPYRFFYEFKDSTGKKSCLSILDWEIGSLFLKQLKSKGSEEKALEDVKKKYSDDFLKNKDIYFFLGTSKEHHFTAKNPYMIIGVFYPKKDDYEKKLFD